MKTTVTLQAIAPLLSKPCFSAEDAREKGIHPASLAYYVKTGVLRRVDRGVYQSATYENPAGFRWEDLIEAVLSIRTGVVCLISALAVYDLTEEIPRQHWIAIPHGTSVKSKTGCRITRYRNIELGRTTLDLDGTAIPIFDRERTILDAFRLLSRETAIKALRAGLAKNGADRLNLAKLRQYAKALRVDITPYLESEMT